MPLRTTLAALAFLCLGSSSAQELQLFELFTNHAILQRDVTVPIWGWAEPDVRVIVIFDGDRYRTRSDANGFWRVELPPRPAGGPYTMIVRAKREAVTIGDLYFGDVFLLSGQSNMEWEVANSDASPALLAAVQRNANRLRHAKVQKSYAETPEEHLLIEHPWESATAENLPHFSAVGTFFAHYLLPHVPDDLSIGLVHSSWGGSRIEPWMSAKSLGMDRPLDFASSLDALRAAAGKTLRERLGEVPPASGNRGQESGWSAADFDDSGWPVMTLPRLWESDGLDGVDGVFWFRTSFELTPEQAARPAVLHLGPIDDADITYLNGRQVGTTSAYNEPRHYTLPAEALRPGRNTLAVRVTDTGGGGGIYGAEEELRLELGAESIGLAGDWRFNVAAFTVQSSSANQQPTLLYNKMIHPLLDFPIRGVLWYQGESNAGPGDNAAYAEQFKTMIRDWRTRFGLGELPFYWVQLANFMAPPENPTDVGSWPQLRASQSAALELPNTAEAVIIDIGEADDIHPRNKSEVGRRLSLAARHNIYGEAGVAYRSPRVAEVNFYNTQTTIRFDYVGAGLEARDRYGIVKSITVQDEAGEWHWAPAMVVSYNQIVVMHAQIGKIKAVRYAWANNPEDANLYTQEGLPAAPFWRTE
jgi:sialate O-acetylesterase